MEGVALWGQECTHVMPKSYQGLLGKSSRIVALGVRRERKHLTDRQLVTDSAIAESRKNLAKNINRCLEY